MHTSSLRRFLRWAVSVVLLLGCGTVHAQSVEFTPIVGLTLGEAVEPPTVVTEETLVETVIRPAPGFGIRVRRGPDSGLAVGASLIVGQGVAQSIRRIDAGFAHRKEMLSFVTDVGIYHDFSVPPVVVTLGALVGPEVLQIEDSTDSPFEGFFFTRTTEWRVSGGPVAEVSMSVVAGLRVALGLSYRMNRPGYLARRPEPIGSGEAGDAEVRLRAFIPKLVLSVEL